MFDHPDFDAHEGVHIFSDADSGLQAIIAVHNTLRGPGCGGTRFWRYSETADALADALRLSKAMSYKNAMADLDIGGGKGVIIKPKGEFDRAKIFAAYGRAIDSICGRYITAEDVGVSPEDMAVIKSQTNFVAGLETGPAASGDPSPVTAEGVFRGIKVAVKHRLGKEKLNGLRVAVQGIGHVGYSLCEHLYEAGCELIVADINQEALKQAQSDLGAEIVSTELIHMQDVDIYAPCALGGAISKSTLPDIQASIIAGAANNQLATPEMGEACRLTGILYAPDYVINAGGIINVAAEVSGTYDPQWVKEKLDVLEKTLDKIFLEASKTSNSTDIIADNMARLRLGLRN